MVAQMLPLTSSPHAHADYTLQPCLTIRVDATYSSSSRQAAAIPPAPQLIESVRGPLLRYVIATDQNHTLSTFHLHIWLKRDTTEDTVRCLM